jgi:hypothetical protein
MIKKMIENGTIIDTSINMITAREKLSQWLPQLTNNEQSMISSYFNNSTFDNLFKEYINRIRPLKEILGVGSEKMHSEDCLFSGIPCFYSGIMISLIFYKEIRHIEDLADFTSLYLLCDHFLDDCKISDVDKREAMLNMVESIESIGEPIDHTKKENIKENNNPYLAIITEILTRISVRNIKCIPWLKKAFYAEIESVRVQSVSKRPRECYLKICEKKGGLTVHAIKAIINGSSEVNSVTEPNDQDYAFGFICQLLDDQLDILIDIESGINTIATEDFTNNGDVDHLLFYTIYKIYELGTDYNLFKPFFMGALCHAIAKLPSYSKEVKNYFQPFYFLNKDCSVSLKINEILMKKLSE